MSNMNFDELLKIAKDSIIYFFKNHNFPNIEDHSEKKATFVTLEKNGELRGCIGEIFPVLPIKKSVSRNAINAAFYDPRFFPLSPEETKDLTIEVSVLSPLKKFEGEVQRIEKVKRFLPVGYQKEKTEQLFFHNIPDTFCLQQ